MLTPWDSSSDFLDFEASFEILRFCLISSRACNFSWMMRLLLGSFLSKIASWFWSDHFTDLELFYSLAWIDSGCWFTSWPWGIAICLLSKTFESTLLLSILRVCVRIFFSSGSTCFLVDYDFWLLSEGAKLSIMVTKRRGDLKIETGAFTWLAVIALRLAST